MVAGPGSGESNETEKPVSFAGRREETWTSLCSGAEHVCEEKSPVSPLARRACTQGAAGRGSAFLRQAPALGGRTRPRSAPAAGHAVLCRWQEMADHEPPAARPSARKEQQAGEPQRRSYFKRKCEDAPRETQEKQALCPRAKPPRTRLDCSDAFQARFREPETVSDANSPRVMR